MLLVSILHLKYSCIEHFSLTKELEYRLRVFHRSSAGHLGKLKRQHSHHLTRRFHTPPEEKYVYMVLDRCLTLIIRAAIYFVWKTECGATLAMMVIE